MSDRITHSTQDSGESTVFMGAHVPLGLYRLLAEEAERAGVSRSQVLRWALLDRYSEQQAAATVPEVKGRGSGKRQGGDDEEKHDEG